MSQALVNIFERMKYRNFRSLDVPYKGWRPRPLSVAVVRDLHGICIVKHHGWWRHEVVHVPHPRNIRCAQARCFFLWHRLPGEVGARRLRARLAQVMRAIKERFAHKR